MAIVAKITKFVWHY